MFGLCSPVPLALASVGLFLVGACYRSKSDVRSSLQAPSPSPGRRCILGSSCLHYRPLHYCLLVRALGLGAGVQQLWTQTRLPGVTRWLSLRGVPARLVALRCLHHSVMKSALTTSVPRLLGRGFTGDIARFFLTVFVKGGRFLLVGS